MQGRIGIIGFGCEGFRPVVGDLSTREMMFAAATKAYADAAIDPRREVDSFVCCTEDLWEGWSIADEMVPDQIGGAQRPVCTVAGDGIAGLGHVMMQINAGVADVATLEAHSKVADVLDKDAVERLAIEPTYLRPLGIAADTLAELEMSAFLGKTGFTLEDCHDIVKTSSERALENPRASYGCGSTHGRVSEAVGRYDNRVYRAPFAEGSVVLVLASERWIKKHRREAVYVDGVAWRSSLPWYEGGSCERAEYAGMSFRAALKQAGKEVSPIDFDVLELDDAYAYKLLQHLHSILPTKRETAAFMREGSERINPSGGSLGVGNLIEASALHRIAECVLQLRDEAGPLQVKGAKRALVLSWRGIPTASGGAAILSS